MPKFPVLKPRQVIAALEKAGFRQVRQRGVTYNSNEGTYWSPFRIIPGI
ncbi:MAG: type II toxin-antitoxin system HicA family toxin [Anaerolineales bacterium]